MPSKRPAPKAKKRPAKPKPKYDCSKCPGYCCSYDEIPVTMYDLRRLGKRFDMTAEEVERRYTKKAADGSRVMRQKEDHIFDSTCHFFDQENRRCTVYEHRMTICRQFPDKARCGYFDFMMWERENQDDDEYVPIVL